MRRTVVTILLMVTIVAPALSAGETKLRTEKEKVSYCIGLDLGSKLRRQSIDVDLDLLFRGMEDSFTNADALLSVTEQRETMVGFQRKQKVKMEAVLKEEGLINRQIGERFLSDNRGKPGVVVLASGLQYKVIVEGKGPRPEGTDTVETHYRGRLVDGTEFDDSYSRGGPSAFPVKGIIKGWTEALQLMNVGSKWELYIPADLAYGDRGAGAKIPPGATLIFEVELLRIVEK